MESPSKGRLFSFQGDLLLERPLFSLGGHLYQYQNLLCQMQLIGYRVFLGCCLDFTLIMAWTLVQVKRQRNKQMLACALICGYEGFCQGRALVPKHTGAAAPDRYKAALEAFIGFISPPPDSRYTLRVSQCHLDICSQCETRRMRSHLRYTRQQQWKGCLDHFLKVLVAEAILELSD